MRLQPVADKNFLRFLGKPLIIHQIESLIKADFNEILVMGGAHNLARLKKEISKFSFKKAKISFKEQEKLELGMAGAILSAKSFIKKDPFLVMSSNDVVDKSAYELLRKNIKKNEGMLLAKHVKEYFPGGYLKTDSQNKIKKIVEKPGEGKEPSKLVNIVMHFHPNSQALLDALENISSKCDDRYECALQKLFDDGITYRAVPFKGFWQAVKYPWHVISLMNYFLGAVKSQKPKSVQIAKSATVKGEVYLEEGVKVLENAVIIGPAYIGKNTIIATNALVRQSHIGANCVIGFGSEVARSFVGGGVWTHTNYIGDSIVGDDVSFGAGAVTGNLRLDEKNIQVAVNGGKLDCGSNKFGLVTGDHVRVGVNTSFMPGIKVGSNSFVGAGIVVGQDVPENSYVTGEWHLKVKENREKIAPRKTL